MEWLNAAGATHDQRADESIVERFHAISVERRLKHPAVVAISESARTTLFKTSASAGESSPAS